MKRLVRGAVSILSIAVAHPAISADYFGDLRPSYPEEWQPEETDPLRIELGVRYWYSIGQQKHSVGAYRETIDSKSHVGEAFGRVLDHETRSYVEAFGGYGIAHEGSYSVNGGPSTALPAARLGYVGLDFGWLPLGTENAGFGLVTGYLYSNDSPDTGRASFATGGTAFNGVDYQLSGFDSEINNFDIHSFKLGLGAQVDMGGFDISGEATAIPYSWVNGTYGAVQASSVGPYDSQASSVKINGHGYGASGKLMVGFKPTENLAIRVGGRASYLTGQYDATWDEVRVIQPTPPSTTPSVARQTYIVDNNPFSMLRYGALLEIAGSF
ncbi:hypothetical protein VW35_03745 [Devosia soli]|uniref:Outer membrane protein beta-barrel domain-containing protein n=1 Tax=Devosia soli TaxID=361041 RepID=A0A0F5LFS2_9HYPH|nr:hypothetical protein [Devosia soli]KKB81246.1 hypothetical protein VW35_03745 [Devosia soli]